MNWPNFYQKIDVAFRLALTSHYRAKDPDAGYPMLGSNFQYFFLASFE
jgi:hypothetical protein